MRRTALWVLVCALLAACAPEYVDLPMTPTQGMAQAEDALRRGEYDTAVAGFSGYLASGERTFRARAFFELAQAQYGLENYELALDTLNDLEDQYPNQDWPQISALRGDIYYALGKRPDAIRQWDIAWDRGSDADRQFLRARIEETIGQLTPAQADELAGELQSDDVLTMLSARAPAAVAAAERVHVAATPTAVTERAPPEPGMVAAVDGETSYAEEAAALGTTSPEPANIDAGDALASGARIVTLLPLTGPDRAYGQRALTGLRLAFASFPHMLMVRDTGGQPDLAAQLLAALADDPTVLAAIGPLRSSTAATIAPIAERLQLPMLLLARDQGLSGPYVLQVATTQQEQMQALANYAAHTLGLSRLGVVYPDDTYGRTYRDSFSNAISRAGATVVKSTSYRAGDPNVATVAAAVKAWVDQSNVQAIFIPDAAPTAVKVAAAARGSAPHVQLLGTESWNQPEVLARAGTGIDGAVFADSFFIGSGTPSTVDFVKQFRAQNGHDPTGLEAQAYDAGMLVREAIAQGARTRGAVLQYLRAVTNYQGAGTIASGATGLKPDLVLLQVRDGQVQTLSQ